MIDGSNHCILRVDRDCVERIHRAYAVAMALPSPRPRAGWKKAEGREKREERREQMAASSIHCIFTVSRDHLEKVLKIRNGHPARFTAFLRCPVTTSMRAAKAHKSNFALFRQNFEKQRVQRRGSPTRFTAYLRCLVTTSMRAEKFKKNLLS